MPMTVPAFAPAALIASAPACPDLPAPPPAARARDAAGTVWVHANPAELYRWIARRNDLLSTIAGASRRGPTAWDGLRAN